MTFKGIGYELQPLIAVTGSNEKTKLTFDLNDFNNAEGQYLILDITTGEEATSFTGKKGINEVEFGSDKAGGYAIVTGDYILGIIEVVDSLKTANLEEVRELYLSKNSQN